METKLYKLYETLCYNLGYGYKVELRPRGNNKYLTMAELHEYGSPGEIRAIRWTGRSEVKEGPPQGAFKEWLDTGIIKGRLSLVEQRASRIAGSRGHVKFYIAFEHKCDAILFKMTW